jgi:hypothetical protein
MLFSWLVLHLLHYLIPQKQPTEAGNGVALRPGLTRPTFPPPQVWISLFFL